MMMERGNQGIASMTSFNLRRRTVAIAAVLGTWVSGALAVGDITPSDGASSAPMATPLSALGVELVGIRLSGADFLIDVRYRVKDVAKAQALMERKVHPVLVNEATGDRYYVPQAPKLGQLRQSATAKQPVQLDKVYFMLFANPDRKLRSGEKVTLHAGESTVRGLLVQ